MPNIKSAEKRVQIAILHSDLSKRRVKGSPLHFALGALPGLRAKAVGGIVKIKEISQGAFLLFLSHRACRREDGGVQKNWFSVHVLSFLMVFVSMRRQEGSMLFQIADYK